MMTFLIWKTKLQALWKKEKAVLILAFFVSLGITMFWGITVTKGYAEEITEGISAKVVRFHVLANSDSDADQALKLAVRDRILQEYGEKLEKCASKKESLKLLEEGKWELSQIAADEVRKQGYSYPVTVSVVREYFPQKQYDDLIFPAGVYDGLRVEIGKAAGQNWWCVLYPQMCYVDASFGCATEESHVRLSNALTKEEYLVVSAMGEEKVVPKMKLKVVELWQR